MIENWLNLITNMNGAVRDLRQAAPDVMKTFSDMARAAHGGSALDDKTAGRLPPLSAGHRCLTFVNPTPRAWSGMPEVRRLRDRFWDRMRSAFGDRVVLNGHPERRLPNTLNVSFIGCVGGELLARMPSIAASTGSACHAGQITLSPVLEAMGVGPEVGRGAIRFSLGRGTTQDEIEAAVEQLGRVVGLG